MHLQFNNNKHLAKVNMRAGVLIMLGRLRNWNHMFMMHCLYSLKKHKLISSHQRK